ncbi:MAG: hypothetical protein ACOX0A_00080 [Thermoguttaceae bacterium]|jgi:hypothetical protein
MSNFPIFADVSLGSFLATVGLAFIAFLIFGAILAIPALRGRKIKRTCACAGSRRVLRILEERERAARDARRYNPETVDTTNLPIAPPELTEWTRSSSQGDVERGK